MELTDDIFWTKFSDSNLNNLERHISYVLKKYGTSLRCNRFVVGNVIEKLIINEIKKVLDKNNIIPLPNENRFDVDIEGYKKFSIKYSRIGNITLHNSNSIINRDVNFRDSIIITPKKIYFITTEILEKTRLNIDDYLINKGDSLKLKRTFLTHLDKNGYPYVRNIQITHDKNTCEHKSASDIVYMDVLNFVGLNSQEITQQDMSRTNAYISLLKTETQMCQKLVQQKLNKDLTIN